MTFLTTDALGVKAEPSPVQTVGELRARFEGLSDETPLIFIAGVGGSNVVLTVSDGAMSVVQDFEQRDATQAESLILTVAVASEDVIAFVFSALGGPLDADQDDEENTDATDVVANEQEVAL